MEAHAFLKNTVEVRPTAAVCVRVWCVRVCVEFERAPTSVLHKQKGSPPSCDVVERLSWPLNHHQLCHDYYIYH